jgi:hypothetical protein
LLLILYIIIHVFDNVDFVVQYSFFMWLSFWLYAKIAMRFWWGTNSTKPPQTFLPAAVVKYEKLKFKNTWRLHVVQVQVRALGCSFSISQLRMGRSLVIADFIEYIWNLKISIIFLMHHYMAPPPEKSLSIKLLLEIIRDVV